MDIKIIDALLRSEDADRVINDFRAAQNGRISALIAAGYEIVSEKNGNFSLDGGVIRHVFNVGGKLMALRVDLHEKMVADMISTAQEKSAPQNVAQNICPALIDGQLCGGSLSATPVCPKCALGKQGVAQIMTCDVCGAQTAVMR